MILQIIGFFSIKLALFYANHVDGQHMSGDWLNDNVYRK